jgi:hypothetical protein
LRGRMFVSVALFSGLAGLSIVPVVILDTL